MAVDRNSVRGKVRRKLARARAQMDEPYLPMLHPVGDDSSLPRLSCEEWEEYRQRWELHVRSHQNYPKHFRRPRPTIANAVWDLLAPTDKARLEICTLVPTHGWLEPGEEAQLPDGAKQAFLIVIDTFVNAGRYSWMVTLNDVFEALARGFSDNFLESPASTLRDMTVQRVKRCRRDLLVNGIELKKLWELVTGAWSYKNGGNPLFYREWDPPGGYWVIIRQSPELKRYDELVGADTEFVRTRRSGFQLLPASRRPATRDAPRRLCAERPYNAVEIGKASRRLLFLQARARLLLDVQAFKKDFEAAELKEQALEEMIRDTYDVFPRMSDVKRWIPVDPKRPRGRKFTRYRIVGGKRYVQTWSPRERDIFYRALHEGRQRYRSLHEGRRRPFPPDDQKYDRALREELKTELKKWRETHLRNYLEWRNPNRGGRGRRASQPLLRVINDPSPVSAVQLIRAWLASADWRRGLREALREYDRANNLVTTFRRVYDDVCELEKEYQRSAAPESPSLEHLPIRSGFYRVINRRYQPTHFWPTFVSARNIEPNDPGAAALTDEYFAAYRERWFKVRDRATEKVVSLVGLDVASSQTQILAFLLNDKRLEELTRQSFKYVLAKRVWDNKEHRALLWTGTKPYTDPEKNRKDERLQELVKTLWMRTLYGSTPTYILDDLKRQPEVYGPTLRPKNAFTILKSWPEYTRLSWFLRACERLAEAALEKDRCAGVKFVDPLDGATVRWNPVWRNDWGLASEAQRLILSLPGRPVDKEKEGDNPGGPRGHWLTEKYFHHSPDKNGEFPIGSGDLGNMVAPCLIHALDAYFSSLVMKKLAGRGIRDFVGVHDCWLVPEEVWIKGQPHDGKAILETAIAGASRQWYQGLRPVYDLLIQNLGHDKEFGRDVKKLKESWEVRRKTNDIPIFYAPT